MQPNTISIASFFLAAIALAALLGAIVQGVRYLNRRPKAKSKRQFSFLDLPEATPLGAAAAAPAAEPVGFQFAAEPELRHEPEPQPEPEAQPEPVEPGLEVYLLAPEAPEHIRLPMRLSRGRILEVGLPLWVVARGRDAEQVLVRIEIPNEITYGGSLEHLAGGFGLPAGARAGFASGQTHTAVEIALPLVTMSEPVCVPAPVSVTQMSATAHPISIGARAGELEAPGRTYVIELVEDLGQPPAQPTGEDAACICRLEDEERERDPRLPLDRIRAARFVLEV